MPLSWNEIKSRAIAFSKAWENETSEDAEAKSFWDGFFNVFGITRKRVASFEEPVKKLGAKQGFIDLFWKGILLVEHKSRGKNLDRAYTQALDYFPGIEERDLPKYILVSDFARFRLYDLEEKEQHEFGLKELHKNVHLFGFVAGYQKHKTREEDPVNIKAAENMGRLHDQLKEIGYDGHQLELYLVRLLFCLFAEDTGIFERRIFQDYIEERTCEDGSDLAHHLSTLFQILNTQESRRLKNLDEQLAAFPYVNGKLFEELLPTASFDRKMRQTLLDCCALDWSRISPAIFGSLFQSIMDKTARRNLGAHYTSEKNILKLIKPLFLDELWEEFNKVKSNRNKLTEFHQKLRSLKFLDPACGCGNFLVIAYRELRLLELEVIRSLHDKRQQILDVQALIKLDVDQFYGIEIEEFPAQIAQVALWLVDHQMNMQVSEEFGLYYARIPLRSSGTIVCANALQIDWNGVVPAKELNYIMGNPPFIGHHMQTASQKKDMLACYGNNSSAGVMDFVTAWYCKSVSFIKGFNIIVAFVSTNSITQGEQVGILWRELLKTMPLHIHFAHRTFKWNNEAKGKAAVYCVIIGLGSKPPAKPILFDYETPLSEPTILPVKQINAYLVDAPWVLLENRSKNPFGMPEMMYGSKPTDDGNYLLTDDEKIELLKNEPAAAEFIKPFISAHEYLHGIKRWVIWLVNADPTKLKSLPLIMSRIKAVESFRKASKAPSTRNYPHHTLFRQVTQPDSNYILIPGHTSENRFYIPFGFFDSTDIVGNSCFSLPNATLFHFGVISSAMHMAWVRYTCGRIKSDYRYSKDIVYNNFPWPIMTKPKLQQTIEKCAKEILTARAQFPESPLADLYDPHTMPPALLKAHHALDKAVDMAYGKTTFNTEADRIAFLFELYQQLCSSVIKPLKKPARKK